MRARARLSIGLLADICGRSPRAWAFAALVAEKGLLSKKAAHEIENTDKERLGKEAYEELSHLLESLDYAKGQEKKGVEIKKPEESLRVISQILEEVGCAHPRDFIQRYLPLLQLNATLRHLSVAITDPHNDKLPAWMRLDDKEEKNPYSLGLLNFLRTNVEGKGMQEQWIKKVKDEHLATAKIQNLSKLFTLDEAIHKQILKIDLSKEETITPISELPELPEDVLETAAKGQNSEILEEVDWPPNVLFTLQKRTGRHLIGKVEVPDVEEVELEDYTLELDAIMERWDQG